jgi:hypothetical protein
VIFRHLPIRAQAFVGERLEKEGWFDDSAWSIDEDRSGLERWFPEKSVAVGGGANLTEAAWARAFSEWEQHGQQNGLYYDAAALARLEERAKLFREKYKLTAEDLGPDLLESAVDAEERASYRAHRQLYFYRVNREMSNYAHHYAVAEAEKDRETIQARKCFFHARRLNELAEPDRAIDEYERGFALWQKVLGRYPDFRNDSGVQDDICELQILYLDLVDSSRGQSVRSAVTAAGILGGAFAGPVGIASGTVYKLPMGGKPLPLPVVGPLDQIAPDGKPWLDPSFAVPARSRLNRDEPPPPTAEGGPPTTDASTRP